MTDYVDFDEFGISSVRCMMCDQQVAYRTYQEMPNKFDSTKKERVLSMRRSSNWRQRRLELDLGGTTTYVDLIVCPDCLLLPIDNIKKIKKKIVNGWIKEMDHIGKKEDADKLKDKYKMELEEG